MFSSFPAVKPLLLVLFVVTSTAVADVFKGAYVINARDGAVLFAEKEDYVGPPASVTKLMTFLIVQDAIKAKEITLQTPVTVTAEDAGMGGTQVWLKHNEVFTVEELLYALIIQSANDAAHALSHAAAPSREAFVAKMNARAQQLGMTDTIWRSPHGLPPRSRRLDETDMTSPRDLAKLALALIRETDILDYSAIQMRPFGESQRDKPVIMRTHNHLLGKVDGVDGLKTGFTRAAGFCLAATAERNGHRLIAVIMGCPTSKERDIRMAELLETAFAQLPASPSPISLAPEKPKAVAGPPSASAPAEVPTLSIIKVTAEPSDDNPETSNDDEEPPTVVFELPY